MKKINSIHIEQIPLQFNIIRLKTEVNCEENEILKIY